MSRDSVNSGYAPSSKQISPFFSALDFQGLAEDSAVT